MALITDGTADACRQVTLRNTFGAGMYQLKDRLMKLTQVIDSCMDLTTCLDFDGPVADNTADRNVRKDIVNPPSFPVIRDIAMEMATISEAVEVQTDKLEELRSRLGRL